MMLFRHMAQLRILTYNTGLYRVRVGGVTLIEPIRHAQARVAALADAIRSIDADVVALQEVDVKTKRASSSCTRKSAQW